MTEAEYQMLLTKPGVARVNRVFIPYGDPDSQECDPRGIRIANQSSNESELHDQISDWCKERGWLAFHGSMAHRSKRTAGEPDFIIITDDERVLFVECKTKTGKLTVEQNAIRAHIEKLGQKYYVVRSLSEFVDIARKPEKL